MFSARHKKNIRTFGWKKKKKAPYLELCILFSDLAFFFFFWHIRKTWQSAFETWLQRQFGHYRRAEFDFLICENTGQKRDQLNLAYRGPSLWRDHLKTYVVCRKANKRSKKLSPLQKWQKIHQLYLVSLNEKPSKEIQNIVFYITKTYLYNFDPLKPHFYIVKLGFTGVYIIFVISAQKHRLWVLVRTASSRQF